MVTAIHKPRNRRREKQLEFASACVSTVRPGLIERASRIKQQEIGFVDHDWFRAKDAEARIAALEPLSGQTSARITSPAAGIAFVSGLVAEAPLSGAEERFLFTRMNFLRFRAAAGRHRLNPARPTERLVAQIEADLAEAHALRNRIVQANLRLVVSVARKLAGSLDQLSELISEGLLPMIRAVELFNIQLGNRFSTYATWAVRNQMLRSLKKRKNAREFCVSDEELPLAQLPDPRAGGSAETGLPSGAEPALARLLTELPDRERQILAARFGLNGHPEGQSLAELSAQFGLSKERVRQIALKALATLQRRAAGIKDPEELLQGLSRSGVSASLPLLPEEIVV